MTEIPSHVRRRLFDEWVHDYTVRDSCTFMEYVERWRDDRTSSSGEYERVEREAIQAEADLHGGE